MLEVWNQNIGSTKLPRKSLGKNPSLSIPNSWRPLGFSDRGCFTPVLSVSTWHPSYMSPLGLYKPFPFSWGQQSLDLGPTLKQNILIFNSSTSAKTSPNEVTFIRTTGLRLKHIFCRDIQSTTDPFILLKITEVPKEFLHMWVTSW